MLSVGDMFSLNTSQATELNEMIRKAGWSLIYSGVQTRLKGGALSAKARTHEKKMFYCFQRSLAETIDKSRLLPIGMNSQYIALGMIKSNCIDICN